MLGNFGLYIFVIAVLKTNPFSHHLYKCNFIQNLDFWRFFVYLSNDSTKFFFKSLHIIFIMSETFIRIDLLQHLEISRQTYEPVKNPRFNIHCFDVMLIFPNECRQHIYPRLVHFSVSIVNVLHSKDAINSLVMEVCIVRTLAYESLR